MGRDRTPYAAGMAVADLSAGLICRTTCLWYTLSRYVSVGRPVSAEDGLVRCLFVSDLHGRLDRYGKLFAAIERERPHGVFLGGDLLPKAFAIEWSRESGHEDFISGYLASELGRLRAELVGDYPRVLVILGNDDPRIEEEDLISETTRGLWDYVHDRRVAIDGFAVYGYSYIPPSPFHLKDWERYDVSRHVDPGSVSPEEGRRSVPVEAREIRYSTIQQDLEQLTGDADLSRAIMLFHSPPYQTKLDRAALDHKMIDHVPLDVNIGSIAIRRFIEARQPLLTLHGHAHESARLTGDWRDRIGRTYLFSAAHDGPELALVRFDPDDLTHAERLLV